MWAATRAGQRCLGTWGSKSHTIKMTVHRNIYTALNYPAYLQVVIFIHTFKILKSKSTQLQCLGVKCHGWHQIVSKYALKTATESPPHTGHQLSNLTKYHKRYHVSFNNTGYGIIARALLSRSHQVHHTEKNDTCNRKTSIEIKHQSDLTDDHKGKSCCWQDIVLENCLQHSINSMHSRL